MKVVICGNTNINDFGLVKFGIIRSGILNEIDEVTPLGDYCSSNNTIGSVPYYAHVWARVNNLKITRQPEKNIEKYGKMAGIIRNIQTLRVLKPDFVIAIWDGRDKMTRHMLSICRNFNIKTFELLLK